MSIHFPVDPSKQLAVGQQALPLQKIYPSVFALSTFYIPYASVQLHSREIPLDNPPQHRVPDKFDPQRHLEAFLALPLPQPLQKLVRPVEHGLPARKLPLHVDAPHNSGDHHRLLPQGKNPLPIVLQERELVEPGRRLEHLPLDVELGYVSHQVENIETAVGSVELEGLREVLKTVGVSFEEKLAEAEVVESSRLPEWSLERGLEPQQLFGVPQHLLVPVFTVPLYERQGHEVLDPCLHLSQLPLTLLPIQIRLHPLHQTLSLGNHCIELLAVIGLCNVLLQFLQQLQLPLGLVPGLAPISLSPGSALPAPRAPPIIL